MEDRQEIAAADWQAGRAYEESNQRDYAEEEYWRQYCGTCDGSPCRCVQIVHQMLELDLTAIDDRMWDVLDNAVHVERKRRDDAAIEAFCVSRRTEEVEHDS